MTEYINKAELYQHLNDWALAECPIGYDVGEMKFDKEVIYNTINDCMKSVGEMPTIDIVHCKDCKYCTKQDNRPYPAIYWCSQMEFDIDEDGGGLDWFCADGERRKENE